MKWRDLLTIELDGMDIFLLGRNAGSKVYEPVSTESGKDPREMMKDRDSLVCTRNLDDQKAWQRALRKSDAAEQHAACRALLGIKDAFEAPENPAKILLVALLASAIDLALPHLPGAPAVYVGCPAGIPPALQMLIRATSGPEERHGKELSLRRPTALTPIIPLGETAPSLMLDAYTGGWVRDWAGKKRRFWLPIVRQAIIVAPSFPQDVAKKLLNKSPLGIPLICGPFKLQTKDRVTLDIDASPFLSFDPGRMDAFVQFEELIQAQIQLFVQLLHQKKKRWKRCAADIRTFLPRVARGRFVQELSSPELMVLACGLALLKEFLRFASGHCGWLTADEAQQFLLDFWRLVLPESAPVNDVAAGAQATGNYRWNDPMTFWAFLAGFVREHAAAITVDGSLARRGDVGMQRQLPDGARYLIFPRAFLLQAYVSWLQAQHARIPNQDGRWEAQLQTKILNWGIRVKTEGKDVTWRFTFYQQGEAPNGLREKLACLAFPIDQIPAAVMESLPSESVCGSSEPPKANSGEVPKIERP